MSLFLLCIVAPYAYNHSPPLDCMLSSLRAEFVSELVNFCAPHDTCHSALSVVGAQNFC